MKAKTAIALALSILMVASVVSYEAYSSSVNRGSPAFKMSSLDSELGSAFSSGSIQAFGQNNTTVLVSGTSSYYKPADFSTPALESLNGIGGNFTAHNMSNLADYYFHDGSVFGTAWNGSSWVLTGEITWGNVDEGAALAVNGNVDQNLTPTLGKYFQNGGVWFDSWNGSGWLFGGNEDKHASLVGLYHGEVINYTGMLGHKIPDSWIQLIVWNGTSWLIGGHFVFGFLTGGRYHSMLSQTKFNGSGVYSATYGKGVWIIGGGPPAGIEIVHGSNVTENITLPGYFSKWINGLAPFGKGFVAGGEATSLNGHMEPALYYFTFTDGSSRFTNLSAYLPSSFKDGQVQFLAPVSLNNISGILIAGQGSYNETNGNSHGAMALLRN